MTYYTNSNQIKELMTSVTKLEVKDIGVLESLSGVMVLLFDRLFTLFGPDCVMRTETVVRLRPDWMGTILELMKKNEEVYLHWGDKWCRVVYRDFVDGDFRDDFLFEHCNDPTLYGDRTCLIATQTITEQSMLNALRDLLEPIRFGEGIAARVGDYSSDCEVKSLLTFDRADYKGMCLALEGLLIKTMHQRDVWKDRFFYKALEADYTELCSCCKEDMRKTFYHKGDEEAALKWRPGEYSYGCVDRKHCKDYSWESFEDRYFEDYLRDLKADEYTSDNDFSSEDVS